MIPAPLRIIVVGIGAMGRTWLDVIAADRRWQVAAVVDYSPVSISLGGVAPPHFTDVEVALEQVATDAVLVVTPPDTRRAVMAPILRRGLPVLCEKPLAGNLADGVALLNATRANGGRLMVAQSRRWLPHIIALRDAVQAGTIGSLGYVTCQFRHPFRNSGWRDQMPEVLIEDMAIHHFDSIRFITGLNGRQVFAHSFRPAWSWFNGNSCAAVDLVLEGGIPVHYFGSWVARGPRSAWDGELILVGSEGALVLQADETVQLYRGEDETPISLPLPKLQPVGLARGLERFAEVVANDALPDPDVEDNILSLALTSAAVAASRTARPVDVDTHLRRVGWSPIRHLRRAQSDSLTV
jgi:predicted dehydrogenase